MISLETQQRIFDAFRESVPADWGSGKLKVARAGKLLEYKPSAVTSAGETIYLSDPGMDLGDALDDLAEESYTPNAGAFLSAVIDMTPDGRISIDLDYDDEPSWSSPVVPATYVEEQDMFPRDAENQPEWYRQKLQEASSG